MYSLETTMSFKTCTASSIVIEELSHLCTRSKSCELGSMKLRREAVIFPESCFGRPMPSGCDRNLRSWWFSWCIDESMGREPILAIERIATKVVNASTMCRLENGTPIEPSTVFAPSVTGLSQEHVRAASTDQQGRKKRKVEGGTGWSRRWTASRGQRVDGVDGAAMHWVRSW